MLRVDTQTLDEPVAILLKSIVQNRWFYQRVRLRRI